MRLARAVARAEAGTSGEIVVMVSAQAGAYRSTMLLATLVAALILPWPLLAWTAWSATAILLAQAGLVAALLLASQQARLRTALVPRGLRRARAREAARRAFWSRGLSLTRSRTGVLLYLSLAERHAEIVTDLGVLGRIPPEAWDEILADLVRSLGTRRDRGRLDGGDGAGRRPPGRASPGRGRRSGRAAEPGDRGRLSGAAGNRSPARRDDADVRAATSTAMGRHVACFHP